MIKKQVQCSSSRAREWARTQPPARYMFRGYRGLNAYCEVTCGEVAAMEGTIDPDFRWCEIEVIIETIPDPVVALALFNWLLNEKETCWRNANRNARFLFSTGKTRRALKAPTEGQIRMYGDAFWDETLYMPFHWPTIHDHESGNQYVERCAKLILLFQYLLVEGHPLSQVIQMVSKAERVEGAWEMDRVLAWVQMKKFPGNPIVLTEPADNEVPDAGQTERAS